MQEHRVAALDVGRDVLASKALEDCDEQLHRQDVAASDIDAPEECDVRVHQLIDPRSPSLEKNRRYSNREKRNMDEYTPYGSSSADRDRGRRRPGPAGTRC